MITWAELEGERVRLRPLDPSDAEVAYSLIHDRPRILRWLIWRGPTVVSELEAYYRRWAQRHEEGTDYHFAVVDAESGSFAGSIGVRFGGHPGVGDLGYWLGEPHWGRGLATEAIGLITHFVFTHLEANSLCAWVFVGNQASRRALEKNSFTHTRTVPARATGAEKPDEQWYLVLLRSEWERREEAIRPIRERVRLE